MSNRLVLGLALIAIVVAAAGGAYLIAWPAPATTTTTASKPEGYDFLVVTQKGMVLLYGNPTTSGNDLLGYRRVFDIPTNSSNRTWTWYWGSVPTGYTANSSSYPIPIGNNTLLALNALTLNLTARLQVGPGHLPWFCLAISPDQKYAAVIARSGVVEVIRLSDFKVVWTQTFADAMPCHPFWSHDGKYLTVTMRSNSTVDILDGLTGQVIRTASVSPYGGKDPYMQTVNANDTTIVVENAVSKNDIFYSFPTLRYLGSVNFASVSANFSPVRSMFTPDGRYLIEESSSTNQLAVISTSTLKIVNVINLDAPSTIPAGLGDMDITPDGLYVWTVQSGTATTGGVVYVISLKNFQVVNTIPMTTAPAFIIPVSESTGTRLAKSVLSPPVAGLHC